MTFHYFLRALISGGFSLYILYLVKNGLLIYYIAPKMEIFVKLAAVALIMIAVYQAFAAFAALRGAPLDCGCGHDHDHDHTPSRSVLRNFLAYGLLIAPLMFGYFLPDTALGSAIAEKKGIVLGKGDSASSKLAEDAVSISAEHQTSINSDSISDTELRNMFTQDDPYADQYTNLAMRLYKQDVVKIEEESFLETSTAIDLFMKQFVGKTIQVEGFVYREDEMEGNQFVAARMAMECCSADSTPYGFLVHSEKAASLQEDSWVRVTGTIKTADWDDFEIVMIEASKIEKIEAPEKPYVYPNYDVLEEIQS